MFFAPLIWFVPIFISGFANGVPARSELQVLYGNVIQVHQAAPHLIIELPDGKLRTMEFANFDTFGKQYSFVPEEDAQKLIGCYAEIRGVPMRWVVGSNRFRVYELLCRDRLVAVAGLDKSAKMLASGRNLLILFFIVFWLLIPVPAFIFSLYRERKFYGE